jgi:hypothetical protein
MQIISKYQALDNKVFNTEKECVEYDKLVKKVRKIMIDLIALPKDDSCRFANGGGYIQQKKPVIDKARIELTDLGNIFFKQKDKWNFHAIGRLFNDSGYDCLYNAWGRLEHVDSKYREWGQGYYAVNPNKGVQAPFVEKTDE